MKPEMPVDLAATGVLVLATLRVSVEERSVLQIVQTDWEEVRIARNLLVSAAAVDEKDVQN